MKMKNKTKIKIHFRPKRKQAENDQIAHFRRRKWKRISVSFKFDDLTWLTLTRSDFTTDLRTPVALYNIKSWNLRRQQSQDGWRWW